MASKTVRPQISQPASGPQATADKHVSYLNKQKVKLEARLQAKVQWDVFALMVKIEPRAFKTYRMPLRSTDHRSMGQLETDAIEAVIRKPLEELQRDFKRAQKEIARRAALKAASGSANKDVVGTKGTSLVARADDQDAHQLLTVDLSVEGRAVVSVSDSQGNVSSAMFNLAGLDAGSPETAKALVAMARAMQRDARGDVETSPPTV